MKSTTEWIGIRSGLLTAAGLIVYFLLMRMMGWAEVLELRGLNLVFLVAGMIWALQEHRRPHAGALDYLTGLGIGISTSVVAAGLFALFVGFWMYFDRSFLELIKQRMWMGNYLNPITIGFGVFGEGIGSGAVASFTLMQWYKRYGGEPQTHGGVTGS
ncbi:MAG TPA: DUF4199 domain-containing protein [Luteibaculaceae bacterium]|nr:DUF4199 domain-containing protein [Luteibaculaceae bacterium]